MNLLSNAESEIVFDCFRANAGVAEIAEKLNMPGELSKAYALCMYAAKEIVVDSVEAHSMEFYRDFNRIQDMKQEQPLEFVKAKKSMRSKLAGVMEDLVLLRKEREMS